MESSNIPNQAQLQAQVDGLIEGTVYKSLCEYIEIPNVTHGFYKNNDDWIKDKPEGAPDKQDGGYNLIVKAGQHIADWINTLGVKGAHVSLEKYQNKTKTPIILTEIEASGIGDNKEDTYFFYGHFDKQPPMDDVSPWSIGGPYTPTPIEENGKVVKLYGRGGADDGYSTYATMVAIKALQDQGIPLPRIVMITEGDEETGNGDVEYWIDHFLPRFGTPKLVFCLDSGTLNYDQFWLTNSLRGYLVIDFSVKVLKEAVHSGSGTGVIPTCFRIIRQLLDRIELVSTGEMPKLDLPEIPANRLKEIEELVQALGKDAIPEYPTVEGLETPLPGIKETIILNTWRSQLQVLSIDGYPPIGKTSNIINPEIKVKISIRLPPTLPHLQARQIAEDELFSVPAPYHCELTHIGQSISDNGFDAPENPQPLLDVFEQSSQAVFGKNFLSMGQGGSIPFMNFLKEKWPNAKFVITGLLGPNSNAHGPNECLRVDYLKKLTACFSQIIARSIPVCFERNQPASDGHGDKGSHHQGGHGHHHGHHHGHGHGQGHHHGHHHGKKNCAHHHL